MTEDTLRAALGRIDLLCNMDRSGHPLFGSIRTTVEEARAALAHPEPNAGLDVLRQACRNLNMHEPDKWADAIHREVARLDSSAAGGE